jgi:hypothetical protein
MPPMTTGYFVNGRGRRASLGLVSQTKGALLLALDGALRKPVDDTLTPRFWSLCSISVSYRESCCAGPEPHAEVRNISFRR